MTQPSPLPTDTRSDAVHCCACNKSYAEARAWLTFCGVVFFIVTWFAGMGIAKGFWSTLFSVIFFPYSWYLVIERLCFLTGFAARGVGL